MEKDGVIMDPISILVGAGAATFLISIGWLRGKFHKRHRPEKIIKTICGCTHHLVFHDPKTGLCHVIARQQIYIVGLFDLFDDSQCTCRQYNVPEPLPQFVALPLSEG